MRNNNFVINVHRKKNIRSEVVNGGLKSSEVHEDFDEIEEWQHSYGRFGKFMNTDQNRKHKS